MNISRWLKAKTKLGHRIISLKILKTSESIFFTFSYWLLYYSRLITLHI